MLSVFFLFLIIPFSFAYSITGRVTHVFDGDTIKVNNRYTVRFYGIDTPEKNQEFGPEAKLYLTNLIYGRIVTVKYRSKDQYGRAVGEVFCDGEFINLKMIKRGYAWYYRRYAPNDTYFAVAQAYAENNKLGLWQQESPLPPWEWRKGSRENSTDSVMREYLHGFLYSTGNMASLLISGLQKLDFISNNNASDLKNFIAKFKRYSRVDTGYKSTGSYGYKLVRMSGLVSGYGSIFFLFFLLYIIEVLKNRGNRGAAKAVVCSYVGSLLYCFAGIILITFVYKSVMSGNIKESITTLNSFNIRFAVAFFLFLIFGFLLKIKDKRNLSQKVEMKKIETDRSRRKAKK